MVIACTKDSDGNPIGPIQFSEQEIQEQIHAFYVKVDNFQLYPYGLVPESNEMNNLRVLIRVYRIHLPLILREDAD